MWYMRQSTRSTWKTQLVGPPEKMRAKTTAAPPLSLFFQRKVTTRSDGGWCSVRRAVQGLSHAGELCIGWQDLTVHCESLWPFL